MIDFKPLDKADLNSSRSPTHQSQAARQARYLYQQASHQNWLSTLWLAVKKRSSRLCCLDELRESCTILDHRPLGKQRVQISQIRGSATHGRRRDFDADFRPCKSCNEDRWVGVATVRMLGKKLPPVDLVKIRDIYFVQDGHHRISVAQALGEEEIEAVIIEWQVTGPLPWEERSPQFIQTLIKVKAKLVI